MSREDTNIQRVGNGRVDMIANQADKPKILRSFGVLKAEISIPLLLDMQELITFDAKLIIWER